MKPPIPAASGRTPYTEREAVRAEFCTCHFVWSQRPDGTVVKHERYWRDPHCLLHGDNAEGAPY